jgi:hypothetical protein
VAALLSGDDDQEALRPTKKRKFLGFIDISDDEEEEVEPPRKKRNIINLGFVDLTN